MHHITELPAWERLFKKIVGKLLKNNCLLQQQAVIYSN